MKTVAVIGASTDRGKFGNKAVRAYQQAGWQVYPVNPAGGVVEGVPVYTSLAAVPQPLEVVSVYVPPAVALRLLPEIAAAAPRRVNFNPGADAPEVIDAALAMGLLAVPTCSIVELGYSPSMFRGD
jgi:predicted CoA-binding protein